MDLMPGEPYYPPCTIDTAMAIRCTECGWVKAFTRGVLLSTVVVSETRHQMYAHKEEK